MFLLASCENFLKSQNVKQEIEDAIAYNNAMSSTLIFRAANGEGDFLTGNEKSCKLGYTIDVQFSANTNDYVFKGLEAVSSIDKTVSRAEYVEFTDIGTDHEKKNGVYKIQIKLLKQSDDILIRPVCNLIPRVKSISPAYSKDGCEQDSSITIEFNKSINPQTFNANCISIKNGEEELFSTNLAQSYFDTPKFSNENTILTIPTVKEKYIIPLTPAGQAPKDITVSIISSDIKDTDGLSLQPVDPYTYRINQNLDKEKPEIKSITASNTGDTTNWAFRTLSDKPLDSWSSETEYEADGTTVKYLNGDYSRNHIIDTVHISLKGCDKDSGIKNVKVIEVYEKTKGGGDTLKTENDYEYGINSFVRDAVDETLYSYTFDYTFKKGISDGLYRLDVCVVDKANNVSEPVSYYVIKDAELNRLISYTGYLDVPYSFKGSENDVITEACLPVFNETTGKYESKLIFDYFHIFEDTSYSTFKTHCSYFAIQKCNENNEFVTIFEKKNLSASNLSVVNTLSVQTITEKEITGEINTALADIIIDPDVTTKFKVLLWEENGKQNEATFAVPKRARISGYNIRNNNMFLVDEDNDYSIDSETSVSIATKALVRKKNTQSDLSSFTIKGLGSKPSEIMDENGYTYYIYGTRQANKRIGVLFAGYIYSAFSQPFVLKRVDGSNGFVDDHYDECLVNPNKIENFNFPNFSSPAVDSDSVEFPQNTGKVRFTLNIDFTQDEQNEYEYLVKVVDDENSIGIYSSKTLELNNCQTYQISLLARNSAGLIVAESSPEECRYDGPDNFAPKAQLPFFNAFDAINQNRIKLSVFDWDGEIESGNGIFKQKYDRIKTIECYYSGSPLGTNVTYEELKNGNYPVYKIELTDSTEIKTFDIPVYCVEQGKFYLYVYVQDIEGNSAVYTSNNDVQYGGYMLPIIPEVKAISEAAQDDYKTLCQLTFPLYSDALKPALDAYDSDDGLTGSNGTADVMQYSFSRFNKDTNKWLLDTTSPLYGVRSVYKSDPNNAFHSHNDENWTINMRFHTQSINETKDSFYRVGVSYGMILPDNIVPVYLIPVYFFIGSDDYDYTCRNKSVMDSLNGYQVFCDKPVFAHTMFSKFKLTETNTVADSHTWEGRGAETGIVYNDASAGTFSYTDENFEAIPAGCYYTTIFHFVDGTTVMTPVKQK